MIQTDTTTTTMSVCARVSRPSAGRSNEVDSYRANRERGRVGQRVEDPLNCLGTHCRRWYQSHLAPETKKKLGFYFGYVHPNEWLQSCCITTKLCFVSSVLQRRRACIHLNLSYDDIAPTGPSPLLYPLSTLPVVFAILFPPFILPSSSSTELPSSLSSSKASRSHVVRSARLRQVSDRPNQLRFPSTSRVDIS